MCILVFLFCKVNSINQLKDIFPEFIESKPELTFDEYFWYPPLQAEPRLAHMQRLLETLKSQ